MTIHMLALALGIVIAVTGCERKVSDRDVRSVSPADAHVLGQGSSGMFGLGEKKAAWVDPRSPADYAKERIPGSINLMLNEVEKNDARLKGAGVFIVYGTDYESPLAVAMAKRLIALGYDDVRTLRGGLRGWKQAGHPTEGTID